MNLQTVGWLLGGVWLALAGTLAVPLLAALTLAEPWEPFAYAAAVAGGIGGTLLFFLRRVRRTLGHRSAFLTVSLVWISVCLLGSIPYLTYPQPDIFWVDALFEATSGFTTTGATVLSGLDEMPRSLLLWRSMTQWLGGMGMVIFGVAILPLLGVGGMQLYAAEAPGPTKDKITPRIAETAKLLWVLYLSLTVVVALLFRATGMDLFDAVNHAMTSISTAGFSTHDASLGYFDSASIHSVALFAMLTGGTSFAILHRALTGTLSWSDQPELRAYVGIFCLAAGLITFSLMRAGEFPDFLTTLLHAAFQAASIMTTTGYSTTDYGAWPGVAVATLFGLFFVGGMAGSTSGGVKVIRILLLGRLAFAQFFRLLHPHAIDIVRLGPRTVDDRILASSLGFIGMWLLLLAIGTGLLSLGGTDLITSLTGAAASLGNIGPAFAELGPTHTYVDLSISSKLVSQSLMLLGRLEIYTLLIVLTPSFWKV